LLESTTSDSITESDVAIIVTRADNIGVCASEDWITIVVGTSIKIITEENLVVNTTFVLITSIVGTNRRIITDNGFGPVTVISVRSIAFRRRNKNDTSVNSTSQIIVTIGGVDTSWTKIWAVFGSKNLTALREDLAFRISTTRTTVLWKFINNVFSPLGKIVAITFRPVGETIFARFWAQSNLARRACFVSDITIWLRTGRTSTNSRDSHNISLRTRSPGSIVATITRASYIATLTINRRHQLTWERSIDEV